MADPISVVYAKTGEQLKKLVEEYKGQIFLNTGIDVKSLNIDRNKHSGIVVDVSHLQSDFDRNIDEIKKELKGKVYLLKDDFHNWANTQNKKHVWKAYPRNLEEIQLLVKSCEKYKVKVRCVGSGHSWSPIFPDIDSIFVYMDQLYVEGGKIRFLKNDRLKVEIFAGATTGDFKKFQLDNEVNLQCNAILDCVQMVSVVATGCHGVGKDCLTPGDYVEEMCIVNSSGELKTYTKTNEAAMMNAVTANYGMFGIIYKMTISVENQVIVEMENNYLSVEQYFFGDGTDLKQLVNENYSVEIFWFPFSCFQNCLGEFDAKKERVYARVAKKTTASNEVKKEEFYLIQKVKDAASACMQKEINKFMVKHPVLTPYFGFIAFQTIEHILYPAAKIVQELTHAIHFREFIHENPVNDLEFAFAIDDANFKRVLDIIQVVFKEMENMRKRYPLNIAMEMRFMKYSTSYLCPAKIGDPCMKNECGQDECANVKTVGTGKVFYIEILSAVNTEGWDQFSVNVAHQWFKLGGIPHLAKQWPITSNNFSKVREVLKQPIEEFKEMLHRSNADPKGIFLNAHLKELLSFDINN